METTIRGFKTSSRIKKRTTCRRNPFRNECNKVDGDYSAFVSQVYESRLKEDSWL